MFHKILADQSISTYELHNANMQFHNFLVVKSVMVLFKLESATASAILNFQVCEL